MEGDACLSTAGGALGFEAGVVVVAGANAGEVVSYYISSVHRVLSEVEGVLVDTYRTTRGSRM